VKKYSAVVFDWDGTVMDSTYSIVSAIQAASADLGLPVPDARQAAWVIGLSLESALYRCVPDIHPDQLPLFVERYRHHYFGNHNHARMKLFDGIVDVLDMIRARQGLLAVATGKSRVGLDRALDQAGLNETFQITRCADESAGKPDPSMLYQILDHLALEPGQILMVGDTSHDMDMAANAGVDGLAVTYGAHDEATLQASSPAGMVASVPELQEWLRPRLPV